MKVAKQLFAAFSILLLLCDLNGCTAKITRKEIPSSYSIIKNSDAAYIGSHPDIVLLENSLNYNFQKEYEREIGQRLNEVGVINESQYWLDNQANFESRNNFFLGNYTLNLLSQYRTNKRYLLFSKLEACDINLHTDTGSPNTVIAGALLTATLIGSPLGIPMMVGGGSPRTEVSVSFKYGLYIYDRQVNAIKWTGKVDVTESQRVSGSMEESDRKDTLDYYKSLLINASIISFQNGINSVSKAVIQQ